jgi:hypothetical protein
MKSPHDQSHPDHPEARETTPADEEPEEATEERTIEWDVAQMTEELLELDGEPPSPESGQAIVAGPIKDESAGARSPGDLATRRQRRDTVPSLVPSMLAKSMRPSAAVVGRRRDSATPSPGAPNPGATQPAATKTGQPQVGRPFAGRADGVPIERDGDGHRVQRVAPADVHTVPTVENPIPVLGPVAMLVLKARRCLDAGDVAQAVLAASGAILASQSHADPEVGDLTDTARGPLAPIFVAGPVGKIPVLNRSETDLDGLTLDELGWAFLRRLDGRSTLGQVLGATKIPPIEALQIAASLLRDGVIRIDDRASR